LNFDLTTDQKMLRDTVAGFVRKRSPVSRLRALADDARGWDPDYWQNMGEMGWTSVPFPDAVGGYGGTFADAALIVEQLGTTLVPEPYLASVVLAGTAILRAGTDEQRMRLLPALSDGRSYALAYAERQARFDATDVATRAERAGGGWRLTGDKMFVLNGHAADAVVVSARTSRGQRDRDGLSLFVVERGASGMTATPIKTLDRQRAAMLRFDGAEAELLGEPDRAADVLDEVLDHGAAAACAEGVGIMQTVLAMTVEYLKTR
jgi:alkylation response protein AidB-like acyl-CoA dehydrogenase